MILPEVPHPLHRKCCTAPQALTRPRSHQADFTHVLDEQQIGTFFAKSANVVVGSTYHLGKGLSRFRHVTATDPATTPKKGALL